MALVEASPEEYKEVTAAKPFRDRVLGDAGAGGGGCC